jgi:hypothetical protein
LGSRGRPVKICSSSLRARSTAVVVPVPAGVARFSGGGVDGLQLGMNRSMASYQRRYLLSSGLFPHPTRVVPA